MFAREAASFCRSGGNAELSNVSSFTVLLSGEGLTSFNKDNSANFPGESKGQCSIPGYLFFENTR